jgi:tetratricopeptide (TPR) repeat protein
MKAILERALSIFGRDANAPQADVARALSALGSVKSELGEYDEALALLERAKAMKAAAAREAPTGASAWAALAQRDADDMDLD